ncbi:MAG: hypothetical protein AB8H80_12650 [Planctomycetota bacterium]
MTRSETDILAALGHCQMFCRRLLPGVLRRVSSWKGVAPGVLYGWREDLEQELAADCIENSADILRLTARERHARWMQRSERLLYEQIRHLRRRRDMDHEPCAPEQHASFYLDGVHERVEQLPQLHHLQNGRMNMASSVRETPQGMRSLRRTLDGVAAALGYGDADAAFWHRRTAEGLRELAVDQLCLRGGLHVLSGLPARPDPTRRRLRLARLAKRIPVLPATGGARRALAAWRRPHQSHEPAPHALLLRAAQMQPDCMANWLWCFEAACQMHSARHALAALRGARQARLTARALGRHIPRHVDEGLLLARARLRELRGHVERGLTMLRRHRDRRPDAALPLIRAAILRADLAQPTRSQPARVLPEKMLPKRGRCQSKLTRPSPTRKDLWAS